MSGCLDRMDRIHCTCACDFPEPMKEWLRSKRNLLTSVLSGTLFAVGWWLVIDACAEHATPIYAAFHVCGILSTISLLMINAVSTGQVTGDAYTEGCLGQRGARAWLFVGFLLAFAGLIGSVWIFIQGFLLPAVTNSPELPTNSTAPGNFSTDSQDMSSSSARSPYWWQGIAFFGQNLLIFVSSLVFKFGRAEEESW